MKTRRKYYEDTYLFQSTAKVTLVSKDDKGLFIRLDETIFHPQGGGQPSDAGTINGVNVVKVTLAPDDREEINHYVADLNGFNVGDSVSLKVDEAKRLECGALHTGGHMLANVLRQLHLLTPTNIATVRSHHFPKESYFQVKPEEGVKVPDVEELKKSIHAAMNKMIDDKRAVVVTYQDNTRRMRIDGFNDDPCGGTHLSNTGEVKDFNVRGIKVNNKEGVKVSYDAVYSLGFFNKSQEVKGDVQASPKFVI